MADQVDSTAGQVDTEAGHLDTGLSLPEAAERLGVSERTLRRRIKEGSIAAYKLETPQGHVWRVQLDGMNGQVDSMSTRRAVHVNESTKKSGGSPENRCSYLF